MKIKHINKVAIIVIICMIIGSFTSIVRADDEVTITTLDEFKTKASSGGVIKLGADITLTGNTAVRNPLEIDLNGYTLSTAGKTLVLYSDLVVKDTSSSEAGKITGGASGVFIMQIGSSSSTGGLILESGTIESTAGYGVRNINGTLTMNGGSIKGKSFVIYNQSDFIMNNGEVKAETGIAVQGMADSNFTMNDGLVKTTADYNAVNLSKPGAKMVMNGGTVEALCETGYKGAGIGAYKDTEVTINGGEIKAASFALYGNGSASGSNDGTNAKFTITGGKLTSTESNGIYAPQVNGEVNISGGTITGGTSAIEIRAGTLNITGGILSGNRNEYKTSKNLNGASTIGSAVAIVQHTTKQPIEVNISGGTFYGNIPLSESNGLENSSEDVAKIKIDVSNGVFHSSGDKTVDVEDYSEGFIWGGKYTHWVTEYVKDGYGEKPEDNMIAVYKWRNVNVLQSQYGYTTITRKKTISDDGESIVTEDDQTSDTMVKALYNDEIYITIIPNEGYKIASASGRIVNGGSIAIKNNNFESPDADSEVNVEFLIIPEDEESNSDEQNDEKSEEYNNVRDNSNNNESKKSNILSPITGDNILIYISMLVIAAICLKFVQKRRNANRVKYKNSMHRKQ